MAELLDNDQDGFECDITYYHRQVLLVIQLASYISDFDDATGEIWPTPHWEEVSKHRDMQGKTKPDRWWWGSGPERKEVEAAIASSYDNGHRRFILVPKSVIKSGQPLE